MIFPIDNPSVQKPAPPHVIVHATGPKSLQVDTNMIDPLEAVKMLGVAVQIMTAKIQEEAIKGGNGKILNAQGQRIIRLDFSKTREDKDAST